MLKVHPHEILVLYDKNSGKGKQTIAYAHTISDHVREMEVTDTPISTTLWKVILGMLNLTAKDLLDKSKPYYQENIKGRTFDSEGWLKILAHEPSLLRSPIGIKGKSAILLETPTDILKLEKQDD